MQIGGGLARMTLPAAVTSANYNALNQLSNWGGAAHSYDFNGNLTSDGTNTYTWDSRNRLTGISGGTTASFAYDGLGRRSSKTVAGTATSFLYDGLNPVQEISGSTPTANLLGGLGLDQWFARTDSSGTKSFITDALGSTLALIDASGTVQTQYTYEPYGKMTQSGAASSNAFQYTGRENDNTGLAYYRARYYAPGKGRFIAEDPVGFAGGANVYAYVGGRPTSYIDPLGLRQFTFTFGGAALFGQWGGTADSGFGFDTKGHICFVSNVCKPNPNGIGTIGALGGLGGNVGTDRENFCAGFATSQSRQLGIEIGVGEAGGVSLNRDGQGKVTGGGKAFGGVGGGAGVSDLACETSTYCTGRF